MSGPRSPSRSDREPARSGGWVVHSDVEVLQECEVRLPMLVVTALLEFIDPDAAMLNSGVAILNSGREHKPMHCHRRTPGCCAGDGERSLRASERLAAHHECTSLLGRREARLLR